MMSLSVASSVLNASMTGQDCEFHSVSNDTRTLQPGALYVAIKGERFDGHDYIENAIDSGAVAALVEYAVECDIPTMLVKDTRLALGELASYWRQQLDIKVIALTGSNGKTSVKEMTASILAGKGKVHATKGNFNNEIGLPLTLLGLSANDEYAVIEMGANHPGEIAYLTNLTRPDSALVNNAGSAHLEGFGSLEGVAKAKGEIYSGLAVNGTAIINADDSFADYWKGITSQVQHISFGIRHVADITASQISGQQYVLNTPDGECEIHLQIPGIHNIYNSLAAAALAYSAGADLKCIQTGLNKFSGVSGRMQKKATACGATIFDDTYNANPDSLKVAVDVLLSQPGKHIFVLGDMRELGGDAKSIHAETGLQIKQKGVDVLLTLGELAGLAAEQFGKNAISFKQAEDLVTYLQNNLEESDVVVVKGSRGMHMERVVDALVVSDANQKGDDPCC